MTTIHLEETGDWMSGVWTPSGFRAWLDGQEPVTGEYSEDETEALAALADKCLREGDATIYAVLAKMMEVAIAPGTDFNRSGLTKAAAILRGLA